MRKIISIVLVSSVLITCMVACEKEEKASNNSESIPVEKIEVSDVSNISDESSDNDVIDIGLVEADKNLFTVEITIPATYIEGETQESLEENIADDDGIKSVVINSDGSATYVMTKSAHEKMLKEMRDDINKSLSDMCGTDYPNFVRIEANDNFSEFYVYTASSELSLQDSFAVWELYIYGGYYLSFAGEQVDNIHVDFIDEATGEVFDTADSKDMAEN